MSIIKKTTICNFKKILPIDFLNGDGCFNDHVIVDIPINQKEKHA
jgi:hypothetical protein